MLSTTLERPMGRKASKPDKGKRDDVAVKIDRALADKAKLVASRRRITLAEYLSELTRSSIERDFSKVIKEMGEGE